MKITKFIFAAIGLFVASSLSAQSNVISNGGFELPTWVSDGTTATEWLVDNSQIETSRVKRSNSITAPEGAYMLSLKCKVAVNKPYALLKTPMSGSGISLVSGKKYTFSFEVFSISGGSATPKMALKLNAVKPYYTVYVENTASYFNVSPGSWQTFTYTFTANSAAPIGTVLPAILGLFFLGNEVNTIFYLDKFKIVEN